MAHHGGGGAGFLGGVFGLGYIGAVVYFLQQADSFWMGVAAIFKAIVWPAFLVYHLFVFLKI